MLSTSETAQVTEMFYKHVELIIAYLATERRDQEAAQCDYGSGSVRGALVAHQTHTHYCLLPPGV